MYEYIEGLRVKMTASEDGESIYSVYGWNGRLLFQGTKPECQRYAVLYRAKVREHEERVTSSRAKVS
jgi:hypothetical protein